MHDLLPDWTDMPDENREQRVRQLVLDGKSASLIARHFRNCTRNSVIGFCSRHKIALAHRPGPQAGAQKKPKAHGNRKQPKVQAIVAKKLRNEAPAFETAPLPEEELGNDVTHLIGIMDLKADSCRWMHGDPKGQHGYCGKTTKGNSSWCPHHHDIVFGGRS